MEITSTRAAPVVRARRLLKRSGRETDRRFLAEGPQAVREALAKPGAVVEVLATGEVESKHPELRAAAKAASVPWHTASGAVIAEVTGTITPQGVVATCVMESFELSAVLGAGTKLLAVLAQVRDPGNAGTVIRVADAAGADAVVLTSGSVDPFNPKCVRATAGSLFHLPVVTGAELGPLISSLRQAGLLVLAADGGTGEQLPELLARGALSTPTAWIFGNEAWGLPAEVLAAADSVAAVPIYGKAESLNLSTAAAVCLYASAGSQRPGGPH